MTGYKKRTQRLFDPHSTEPFKISRSKIDLFLECARCSYLDARFGVGKPSMPGFTLNIAVDHLLKKEFDIYRERQEPHPMMEEFGLNAVPFQHKDLEKWRANFTGVQYLHPETNFLVFGAVDDLWINDKSEVIVVDYKATSKKDKPSLEGRWGGQYKRQAEVYQWLLRGNDLTVSDTAYFLYVNGRKDPERFDSELLFDSDLIAHVGSADWVEPVLKRIKETYMSEEIPPVGELCEHCPYREAAGRTLRDQVKKTR